jgi:hypothetical protein
MTAHKAGVRLPDALPQMEEQIAFGKLKLISDTPASATIVAAERPERRGLCSRAAYIHTTNTSIASMMWVWMYELERLVKGVPFEVPDQLRDSVRVGPGFAPVVARVRWMLFAWLIKERWVSTNFFIAGLKQPVREARMDGSVATLGMKAAGCDNRMN